MEVHFIDAAIERFVGSLQKPTIAKVLRTIELLERFGASLGMPQSKCIGRSLFELRIHGSQEVRLIYMLSEHGAVILHGFLKKSRRISKNDLLVAIKRKKMLDRL